MYVLVHLPGLQDPNRSSEVLGPWFPEGLDKYLVFSDPESAVHASGSSGPGAFMSTCKHGSKLYSGTPCATYFMSHGLVTKASARESFCLQPSCFGARRTWRRPESLVSLGFMVLGWGLGGCVCSIRRGARGGGPCPDLEVQEHLLHDRLNDDFALRFKPQAPRPPRQKNKNEKLLVIYGRLAFVRPALKFCHRLGEDPFFGTCSLRGW